jgi:hypothetical protein
MSNYREDRPGASPSTQEQSGAHHKTQEELAQAFRAHIDPTMRRGIISNELLPPHEQIESHLYNVLANSPYKSEKERFFKTLHAAWELLTYDLLDPGSIEEDRAARTISDAYRERPIIELNDSQVRLLDAMAEASGLPHPRGQSVLKIPDKYADSSSRLYSPDWQRRAAAHEERTAKQVEIYKMRER